MHTPKIHIAKLLTALARIISGIAMLCEAVDKPAFGVLGVQFGFVFSDKKPDTFHVSQEVLNVLPGNVRIVRRDDHIYTYEAEKYFMGARFVALLRTVDLHTTERIAA